MVLHWAQLTSDRKLHSALVLIVAEAQQHGQPLVDHIEGRHGRGRQATLHLHSGSFE